MGNFTLIIIKLWTLALFTCIPPTLLTFICSFSFKALSFSQFNEQRQQTMQSFMAISGFWHGLKSCAYEFQCNIKLSEGLLSRAKILSPSFVLCWAHPRYYPCTDKGSILQQQGSSWQHADTAAPLCNYTRGAGRVQGVLIRVDPGLHFPGSGVWCGSKEICLAFSPAVFLALI